MATGFSFIDDPQMSVREKIDRYFEKKRTADAIVLEESTTSEDSISDSFCELDQSFAQILINNPHVTLLRNSNKANATKMETHTKAQQMYEEEISEEMFFESPKTMKSEKHIIPYMPTPTRRGQVRKPIKTDESIEIDPLWNVSDESFVEMEKLCESPHEIDMNDNTLLCDVQAPSFLVNSDYDDSLDDSVFEHHGPNMSMLSPMKQVALRRPSTILEESTIQSINTSDERSGSSLSLKQSLRDVDESSRSVTTQRSYRPSIANVFPTRSRIGFYDKIDLTSSSTSAGSKDRSNDSMRFESSDLRSPSTTASVKESRMEKSINLMRFESLDINSPPSKPATPATRGKGSLIDASVIEATSFPNLSVDQTRHDSSMSDSEPPDQFNDTLEAVDYYIKQGKKAMDKTGASTTFHQQQPCAVVSSPKNRNNSLLKQTLARRHMMSMNGDTKLAKKTLF